MLNVEPRDLSRFIKAANSKNWATVDQLIAVLDRENFWDREYLKKAQLFAKKNLVRRMMRRAKDEDGLPLFASVKITDEAGNKVCAYKQEMLFNLEDYKSVVKYHAGLSTHHQRLAEKYCDRCKAKFNVQLSLWDVDKDSPNDDEWASPTKPR